jgi:hypothetical protein
MTLGNMRELRVRHTAYHEAGHAVIHRLLGLVCGETSIVPNYRDKSWGHAEVYIDRTVRCDSPLSGVKRTFGSASAMSANDPKRASAP